MENKHSYDTTCDDTMHYISFILGT